MHLMRLVEMLACTGLSLAAGYALVALAACLYWYARRPASVTTGSATAASSAGARPPVSVLKPLCGAEPGLYENLRSFCIQEYPEFQVVFGVRDPTDPAIPLAQRLAAEFPHLDMAIVVNPQLHGSNRKVSNLINLFAAAKHEVIVMADSDACVEPDYLCAVVAPLADSSVGLVSNVYHGVPTPGIWSRLGAMYINEWYMPAVLVAWLFGHRGYASGQTLVLRRETLRAIGGLQSIANHLAEDHRLGELVRALGLRIVLSDYLVKQEHHEPDWDSLVSHELRWMCTTRVLRPRSFYGLFISFSLPLAVLALALAIAGSAASTAIWVLFGITCTARLALYLGHRLLDDGRERGADGRRLLADLWLVPVRDALLCWVWIRTFFTTQVAWRGEAYDVDVDGIMRPLP